MAGIFTRPALDRIMNNADLTPEQRTEQVFSLYGRALDEGYISKSAAEDAKQQALEQYKSSIKIPEQVDPKTTPEYLELANERDMLRSIGGDDFASVKPKFREQVWGMLDRGATAGTVADQLIGIKERYEEYFISDEKPKEPEPPKNTPQYSRQPGANGQSPESEEEKLLAQLREQWH